MHLSKVVGKVLFGLILALPGQLQSAERRVLPSYLAASAFEEPLVATASTSPQEDDALRH